MGGVFPASSVAGGNTGYPIIRAVEVVGNRTTRREMIIREMRLKQGMRVDLALMESDRQHLASLGLFNRVRIYTRPDTAGTILVVQVSEPFYFYPITIFSWDPLYPERRLYGLSLSQHNFRGYGERLGAAYWDGYERGFSLFHRDPWFSLGGRAGIDILAFYADGELRRPDDRFVERTLQGLQAVYRRRLARRSWSDLQLAWEQVVSPDSTYVLTIGGRDRILTLGEILVIDRRDYSYYPTRGFFTRGAVTVGRVVDTRHWFFIESLEMRGYQPAVGGILTARGYGHFTQRQLPVIHHPLVSREYVRAGDSREFPGGYIFIAGVEYRRNLLPMHYFSFPWVPLLGAYMENLKFSIETVWFLDRGLAASWDEGLLQDFTAWGAGLQLQVPYVEVIRVLAGWTPRATPRDISVSIGLGVTF